jgi:hypothetical protein
VIARAQLSTGDGLRVTYSYAPDDEFVGVSGIQYVVLTEDTLWFVTFTSDNIAPYIERFELVAKSFVPL